MGGRDDPSCDSLFQSRQAATTLQYIGAASVLYLAYRAFNFVSLWILPKKSLARYHRHPRAWALVTGSSAGIGHGCALELTRRGFNIILLGHLPKDLEQARKAIKNETPDAEIRVIVLDAVTAEPEEIGKAVSDIAHLPLTVLVNNVGGIPVKPMFRDFDTYSSSEIDTVVDLNARFMAQMTRYMLPLLKDNGPSLLVNISSIGKMGFPGTAVYSASKGFVSSFTQALKQEAVASRWPIDIIAIVPGDVKTPPNQQALALGTPTSMQFAKAIMDRVPRAVSRGDTEISPWFMHHVQLAIMGILPEGLGMKSVVHSLEEKKRASAEN